MTLGHLQVYVTHELFFLLIVKQLTRFGALRPGGGLRVKAFAQRRACDAVPSCGISYA